MCGRYVLTASAEELAAYFSVDHVAAEGTAPSYNIAPTQFVPAVASERDGSSRRLELFRWGLVPLWADSPAIGNRMINARAETLSSSRAFRDAFGSRRCLIPADGFYEWQRVADQPRAAKLPWYFHPRGGGLLALGGLWERWRNADGGWLLTCTVITTAANQLMAPVHDRMPVVVAPEHFETWLARRPLEADERSALLSAPPEEVLSSYRVGNAVSNPKNNGVELLAAL
jgi:putative SOS response-associated peptidase YedK